MLQQMLYPQWLNLAPDFRATNTREPSGRSENKYRKLAQFSAGKPYCVCPPLLVHRDVIFNDHGHSQFSQKVG